MVRRETIFEAAGRTPLVPLVRIADDSRATVLVKCESMGPAGSMMDRVVPPLIDEAERVGRLAPGGTVVMSTAGDGGVTAAAVSAVKGHRCILVLTDRSGQEQIGLMKAYGAEVIVCPAGLEREDARSSESVAKRTAHELPGAVLLDSRSDPLALEAHYRTTGPEILEDTEGRVTHLVACMGSGATIVGATRFLREAKPDVVAVGVDAEGSILYDYFHYGRVTKPHPHRLEGVGSDHLPPLLDFSILSDVVRVTDRDAFLTARRLARREGILAGGASGAAVHAALGLASNLDPSDVVVAVLPDAGARYLTTIYNEEWMRESQLLEDGPHTDALKMLERKPEGFSEVLTIDAGATVQEALDLMKKWEISQIPVTREERLTGSIREDQMIDLLVHEVDMREVPVDQVMEEPFPVVDESVDAKEIQHHLAAGHPAVLVKRRDGALGILTKFDLIHQLTS